jgi:predicted transport protein
LHTLGNLTLTGYNSEYSDRRFTEKRDMKGGFAESPLRLNQGLGKLEHWTEEDIRQRSERLAAQATSVWPVPLVEVTILDEYMEFRKQVLALDPCVTEEYLKLYVAYKAETNFVDVVPQAKRLRLSLNMEFAEITDPKGICRDVTGLGRWGNGDVEAALSSVEELPYVIGLVRQSFERQMGNGNENP